MASPAGLLIDTHVLVWLATGDHRLPHALRERMAVERTHVSEISFCELVIKEQARRMSSGIDFDRLIDRAGLLQLPLGLGVHKQLRKLPMIHSDPFARLLAAQALVAGLTLVTRDPGLRHYPVPTIW